MPRPCPSCGTESPDEARFCQRCGTALPAACPQCGADVAADARFCAACGQALAATAPGEERKLATILFADLVGSTALADDQDPELVRARQQTYFRTVSAVIETWGGTVEKYIGDAVVAVFGIPRVREDDALRALAAGLEIVERVGSLAEGPATAAGPRLQVRVGVNTGEVVAATEVRPDQPMVTGDVVNVAARLQAAARPGTVLAGDRTAQQAGGAFRLGERLELDVKGKAHVVVAWTVDGMVAGGSLDRPTRGLRSRMVGRDRELATLSSLFEEAIEVGRPRVALVAGPAGIGKSRLLTELTALIGDERPDAVILRGRCPAIAEGASYWALADIVRSACGIALDDPTDVARTKLEQRGRAILAAGGIGPADIDSTLFALARTAGIEMPDDPLSDADPPTIARELNRAWPRFVSALAAGRPTVLAIEDIHWAGDALVAMLDWISTRSTGSVLLVATSRPEANKATARLTVARDDVSIVSLRPLGSKAGRALIEGLLEGILPAALEVDVLETADGNPLFIEEILARLIEDGSLVREDGGWRAAATSPTVLPDTVQGILAARIDALTSDEKRVLQEASVVGRIFWEAPIATAAAIGDVSAPLARLERRGLISLRPSSSFHGQVEYAFKHALVRDVAYAGLPRGRRALAHAAAADWLAGSSPDQPEELAELVAAHYRAAVAESDAAVDLPAAQRERIRTRGFEALLAGGSAALKRSDVDRAIELHGAALGLANTDLDRARALEGIGDDHDAAYHGDDAVASWDEALAIRRALPEPAEHVARLCRKAAYMGGAQWGGFATPMDPARLDAYVDEGLANVTTDDERAWLLALRGAAGTRWAALGGGDPMSLEARVEATEAGFAEGERLGRGAIAGLSLHMLGDLYLASGDVERSIATSRRTIERADRVELPRSRHLYLLQAFSTVIWQAGDPASIEPDLEPWHRVSRELSAHAHLHATCIVATVRYLLGRWDEVGPIIDETLERDPRERAVACPYVRSTLPIGAIVYARRGDRGRARELLGMTPTVEAPLGIVEALTAMAEIALGEPERARGIRAREVQDSGTRNFAEEPLLEVLAWADATVALEDWAALRDRLPALRARESLVAMARPTLDRAEGRLAAAEGRRDDARALLARAIEGFEGTSVYDVARTRELLAAVDEEGGRASLQAAFKSYERLGAGPDADRLRAIMVRG